MIDAKLLATAIQDGTVVVYGVWGPRAGGNLRFTVEFVDHQGVDLGVSVRHNNYEDTGDGAATGVSTGFAETSGRQTVELLGAKELIRLVVQLERGSSLPSGEAGTVLLRFLEPVWFETVEG